MILATLYFLIFCWVIFKLPFFKDAHISLPYLYGIILLKIFGCFVYYWLYFIHFSAMEGSDSTDTLIGAETIFSALKKNTSDYFKIIFGLHTELETEPLKTAYFDNINDWGESESTNDYFLNDNRTSMRIHAVIRLISNGYYSVHALAMLILSFIGQWAFYKTFKEYFLTKEKLLALIIFISPSVLFWSSGILKEPLAIFIMGIFLLSFFKLFIKKQQSVKIISLFVFSIVGFVLLKPYILILLLFPLIIFVLVKRYAIKRVTLFYVISLLMICSISMVALKNIFHKDVIKTIVIRQNDFINLSKGGIFFINETYYKRLECGDTAHFTYLDSSKIWCKIKPHAKLMYWKKHFDNDTIFDNDNRDTSTYRFVSSTMPAGSAIPMERLTYSFMSFAKLLPQGFYNVLAKPLFYDIHSTVELLASVENLGYILFFITCWLYRKKVKVDFNLLLLFITIVALSFLLIGITTTVMGAIVRYKVPFIPFLLMIPLLFLDTDRLKKIPIIKYMV